MTQRKLYQTGSQIAIPRIDAQFGDLLRQWKTRDARQALERDQKPSK
jgi:hypothetical protein